MATAYRWISLTGGTMGLMSLPVIDFGNFKRGPTYFFWFAGALFLLVQLFSDYLHASGKGRALLAMKESDAFAETVGINVAARRTGIFAVSALFALHPAQVEAVTYVSGRGDLLAGLERRLQFGDAGIVPRWSMHWHR